jgi:hypothetical protein
VTAYRKFSDIIRVRHLIVTGDNVHLPKAPNQTDDNGHSAGGALGGLVTFPGGKAKNDFLSDPAWLRGAGRAPGARTSRPDHQRNHEFGATKVIAPSGWLQDLLRPSFGEPEFDQPCEARRGRVEEKDGLFVHFCEVCGAWGTFGYNVNLRAKRLGYWYCAIHRP